MLLLARQMPANHSGLWEDYKSCRHTGDAMRDAQWHAATTQHVATDMATEQLVGARVRPNCDYRDSTHAGVTGKQHSGMAFVFCLS